MPTKQSKKDRERTVSSSDKYAQCGFCTTLAVMSTCAVECLACKQSFQQECSDLREVNIKTIVGLPPVHWYCRKCLAFATKSLKPNRLKSIFEKLDTLIRTNEQHRIRLLARDFTEEQSTNATCIASESTLKVSKDLTAIIPIINKVAHRVVHKIRSVKSADEKMAWTYASTTATGLQKSHVKHKAVPTLYLKKA